jgi:hypothetical protein
MKGQRRAFTPELKDEAVMLVVNTCRPSGHEPLSGRRGYDIHSQIDL